MAVRRAIVFPGQGTAGGEISGEVQDAVQDYVGAGEVPYQLSVFARSVDLFYRLRERGVEAAAVAGHSLGEYAAAHAAGSLELEDAVGLVAERDRLMSEASEINPGVMVAVVGSSPDEVAAATEAEDGVVVAANFNTPRQTVISGEKSAVNAVVERLGGRKIPLKVIGAFHSALMADASVGMEWLLDGTDLSDPEIPMISGIDGSVLESAEDVRFALRKQMLSPVRWVAVIERLAKMGVEEIVESGEGGTLVRMLRDFDRKRIKVKGRKAEELLS